MTKDDIMKLALESGFVVDGDSWIHAGAVLIDGRKSIDKQLKAFANLVAAAEREACAAMFDDRNVWDEEVGERIRARGTT